MAGFRFSVAALLLALTVSGLGAAHPHSYVGGNDSRVTFAGCPDADEVGPGYVCFEPGEISAGFFGGFIVIGDAVVSPVSGAICTDSDNDGVCGPTEPMTSFCGGIETGGSDTSRTYVFIDGPVWGNPVLSTCGNVLDGTGTAQSSGFAGSVDHS